MHRTSSLVTTIGSQNVKSVGNLGCLPDPGHSREAGSGKERHHLLIQTIVGFKQNEAGCGGVLELW